MDRLNVNLGDRSYEICFTDSFISLPDELKKINAPQKLLIVTDTNVEKLYADTVRNTLKAAGYECDVYAFSAGEENINEYSVSCDSEWNLSNTYVYALAIDSAGYVNNMQVCRIEGKTDYEYIK